MTADPMEDLIQEFAALAREHADQYDKSIHNVVLEMSYESYLMNHTSGEVLKELGKLQELYPDAFYNGDANNHLVEYLENPPDFEFWS